MSRTAPVVLTGLELAGIIGGTVATGGLGTIAMAAIWRLWRYRRRTRDADEPSDRADRKPCREEADRATSRAPFPRQLDEARELLAIRQSEGRVATLDALRGMFLDDELTKLALSESDAEIAVATKLKAAIDTRVDEVAPLSAAVE